MSVLRKKTNSIFYKILTITALFLVALLSLTFILFDKLSLLWFSSRGILETICGCIINFSFFDHPFISSLLLLTSLGLIALLFWGISRVIKIRLATNKFVKANLFYKRYNLSSKLKAVGKDLSLDKKIVEVKNSDIDIFCHGFLRQRICISSSFVKKLSKEELRAALLHEQYHLIVHENIKLFIVNIINNILFIIPGLRLLIKKYSIFSELAADEWAIKNSSSSSFIARAIYKALERREIISYSSVVSFNTSLEERINKIVDNNYKLDKTIFTKKKILANLFILVFMFSFSFFIYSAELNTIEHNDEMCKMDMSEECFSGEQSFSCEQVNETSDLFCHG